MKRLLALLLLTAAPLWAGNRALLIAVENYIHNPDADLPGLGLDLDLMTKVCKMMGFRDDEIRILRGRDATAAAIAANMQSWLINGVRTGDRVLFYYTGHGSHTDDLDGDEPDGRDEILCPSDMNFVNRKAVNVFRDDQFGDLISRVPTSSCYVFIDSCHSGTATRSSPSMRIKKLPLEGWGHQVGTRSAPSHDKGNFTPEKARRGAYVSLSACQDTQSAIATGAGSVFTLGVYHTFKEHYGSRDLSFKQLLIKTSAYIESQISNPDKIHHPQLGGDSSRFGLNIFDNSQPPPDANKPLWDGLTKWAASSNYAINLSSNQAGYRVGDVMTMEVRNIPTDGYINVIAVDPKDQATLLFPNQFQPNNEVKVTRDTRAFTITALPQVKIPGPKDPFQITAVPPLGDTLVMVVHTRKQLNLYTQFQQMGAVDALRSLNAGLIQAAAQRSRNWAVEEQERASFGTGMLVLHTSQ